MNVSANESWVTDDKMLPKQPFKGDLVQWKIQWSRPNGLV
jgi:hypothetical protein